MYKITCDRHIIFDTRLDEDYIVLDPKVNVETNTVGECTFKIYSNHPHYNDLHPLKSMFEVSDENGVIFRGRMTNNTRDFYNGKAVDLEGAMAFFNDSMVKPFVFPDDFSGASSSRNVVEYFLNWLIESHNSQVQDFQKFKLGRVTVTDPNNYLSRSSESIASTWDTLREKLFESNLGGDLCIRYEADGNYIDYLADFEQVNVQEIKLGENLLDMKYETDASATYTAIIPIGADIEVEENGETITKKLTLESIADGRLSGTKDIYKVTLENGLHTLYDNTAVSDIGWICCPVEESTWDDITDANNLKNRAYSFLTGTASLLANRIEVTAADLHFTDEEISAFRIYKKVKVISKIHGVDTYYKLTKLEIDLLNPQNTKIVVGTPSKSLTSAVSGGGSSGSGGSGGSGSGGGITEEYDPTVPEWAKAPTKPAYTASEVGALPDTTKIPTKTSDLINDSDFLTSIPDKYVTEEELEAKHYLTSVPDTYITEADLDTRGYLTKSDIEVELDQFITEDEAEATIEGEVSAVKDELQGEIEQGLETHNTNTEAHNDIRILINELTTRLNTLADSDDVDLDQLSELVACIKSNRSLIEEVTTNKVNVTDIIDNLTTNVANKPLSAAQGVALKALIDALQKALNNHTSDGTAHITAAERTSWNGKVNQTDFNKFSEQTQQAVDEIVDAVLDLREKGGTPHDHSWEEVGVAHYDTGGDTITSDDVIYDDYHKVSECIPTYEDLQNGCSISRYSVSDGAITGELQTINFPEGDYTISESTNGVLLMADGIPMVLISYNGNPEFGAITFSAITEAGVYFAQNNNHCVHSLTINGYTGFPNTVLQKLPRERLPEEFDDLSEWIHQVVDEIVDYVLEHDKIDKTEAAFALISSDTLTWNGDAEGKTIVKDNGENIYAHVSSVVPTVADLQNGGSCRYIDTDEVYPFTSAKTETDDYIIADQYNSVVIAKKDNAYFGDLLFPKKGIYLYYSNSEDYASHFTINGYTGFAKPILKMDSLTPHGHDWYGKAINSGNTVRSDDVLHGGFVKVSDAVPTEAELQQGGIIRLYNVENNEIAGNLQVEDYTKGTWRIYGGEEIWIASDGIVMVQVKADGTYFRQDQYYCIHSLTINGYEGFEYNLEKVPTELLPADHIKQLAAESLSADYIKQLTKEVIADIVGTDTDGLQDLNGDVLYDVLQRKLITKEE